MSERTFLRILVCILIVNIIIRHIEINQLIKYSHEIAKDSDVRYRINTKLSHYLGDCMRQYRDKTGQEYEQQVDGGWFNDEKQESIK